MKRYGVTGAGRGSQEDGKMRKDLQRAATSMSARVSAEMSGKSDSPFEKAIHSKLRPLITLPESGHISITHGPALDPRCVDLNKLRKEASQKRGKSHKLVSSRGLVRTTAVVAIGFGVAFLFGQLSNDNRNKLAETKKQELVQDSPVQTVMTQPSGEQKAETEPPRVAAHIDNMDRKLSSREEQVPTRAPAVSPTGSITEPAGAVAAKNLGEEAEPTQQSGNDIQAPPQERAKPDTQTSIETSEKDTEGSLNSQGAWSEKVAALNEKETASQRPATTLKSIESLSKNELVRAGQQQLVNGDIVAARALFKRAADAGLAEGALALGSTFDPKALAALGLTTAEADTSQALTWYRRAHVLADAGEPGRGD